MEYFGFTYQQIRTMRALLDMTEIHGLENCKNILMMNDILNKGRQIDVSEEVKDGKENL